jgi:hypothetical protein
VSARQISHIMLSVGFGLLVVLMSMTVAADYDFWWHARLGADVLAEGSLTPADTHSYTFAGQPQYNGEWLADLLIYLAFSAGGFVGANLLKALLLAGTCLLLLGAFRARRHHEASWLPAAVITLTVVVLALRFRLYVRPFLFSYLMFAAFLYVLARHDGKPDSRLPWHLITLEVLWANLQKGAFFGPVLLGVYAVSRLAQRRLDRATALAFAGVAIASGLNPDGFEIYGVLWQVVFGSGEQQALVLEVGEHQPVTTELLWGFGLRYTWPAQVLAVLAAGHLAGQRGWRDPFAVLRFVVFLVPALLVVRLISFFSLAVAGLAFLCVEGLLACLGEALAARRTALNAVLGVLLAALAVWSTTDEIYRFGNTIKPDTFPEGALAFLDAEGIEGPLFNSYSVGGYILWQAPHRQVFIDGRARQLYTAEFFAGYRRLLESPEEWRQAEARWGFTHALLDYDLRTGSRHFPEHLKTNPDWALVFWDSHSAVYLKRTPAHAATVARREYRATRPNGNDFSYLVGRRSSAELIALVRQIDREIGLDPTNQEPRLARAFVLLNYGNPMGKQVGVQDLRACLEMPPDLALEHATMAMVLLEEGRRDEALKAAERALALDPNDLSARTIHARLTGAPPPTAEPAMPAHHP